MFGAKGKSRYDVGKGLTLQPNSKANSSELSTEPIGMISLLFKFISIPTALRTTSISSLDTLVAPCLPGKKSECRRRREGVK